jgi:hypothetical protein
MLTLSEIQEQAFKTACAKGWHDRPLREGPCVYHDRVLRSHALMHREVTEAADAYEEGVLFYDDGETKPEGFTVELADVVLRVCDTTRALELTLPQRADLRAIVSVQAPERETFVLATLDGIRRKIDAATEAVRIEDWRIYREALASAVHLTYMLAGGLDLDLDAALRAKMRYNETRPRRHGGKKA